MFRHRHELDDFESETKALAISGVCEGSCEKHTGATKALRTVAKDGTDWGWFSYCESAQEENRAMGFSLYEKTPCSSQLNQAHWSIPLLTMTELSPAAQAVLDAFLGDSENTGLQMDDLRENVAAALHAAADQLLAVQWNGQIPANTAHQLGINWARDALHVLANELEAQ